jgi:phosphomannomutase
MADFRANYFISGEINSEVPDPLGRIEAVRALHPDGEASELDGLSIDYPEWHFNLRPSNTEPLLRLNLESLVSREDMETRRDELLEVIRGG